MIGQACLHEAFQVLADVDRTVDAQGRVLSYRLHTSVHCTQCGRSMWFPGLPTGSSHVVNHTDPTGRNVTLILTPVGSRFTPDPSLPSVTTRNTDLLKGQP